MPPQCSGWGGGGGGRPPPPPLPPHRAPPEVHNCTTYPSCHMSHVHTLQSMHTHCKKQLIKMGQVEYWEMNTKHNLPSTVGVMQLYPER